MRNSSSVVPTGTAVTEKLGDGLETGCPEQAVIPSQVGTTAKPPWAEAPIDDIPTNAAANSVKRSPCAIHSRNIALPPVAEKSSGDSRRLSKALRCGCTAGRSSQITSRANCAPCANPQETDEALIVI
jgi:hypothetical protein